MPTYLSVFTSADGDVTCYPHDTKEDAMRDLKRQAPDFNDDKMRRLVRIENDGRVTDLGAVKHKPSPSPYGRRP